ARGCEIACGSRSWEAGARRGSAAAELPECGRPSAAFRYRHADAVRTPAIPPRSFESLLPAPVAKGRSHYYREPRSARPRWKGEPTHQQKEIAEAQMKVL